MVKKTRMGLKSTDTVVYTLKGISQKKKYFIYRLNTIDTLGNSFETASIDLLLENLLPSNMASSKDDTMLEGK